MIQNNKNTRHATVAQLVEQLICNQSVGGSSPFGGSRSLKMKKSVGEMAERSMAADCKSAGVRLRRFESFSPHDNAGVAQLVEHQPSKLRVASSNLVARSFGQMQIRPENVG